MLNVIVERKRLLDLSQSIHDGDPITTLQLASPFTPNSFRGCRLGGCVFRAGRYKEQRVRLNGSRLTRIVYLIGADRIDFASILFPVVHP